MTIWRKVVIYNRNQQKNTSPTHHVSRLRFFNTWHLSLFSRWKCVLLRRKKHFNNMGAYPLIDIESVLAQKLPKKKIPKAAIWLLKKIIHQDWMNVMLKDYYGGAGIEFAEATLNYLKAHIESYGFERIDSNKKYIFVSNHPLGGLDGVSLATVLGTKFKDVKFLVNELLNYLVPLQPLIVPIKVGGGMQKKEQAERIEETLNSDQQLIIFPAGACSRFQVKHGVKDMEWKKTFIAQAVKHQRDVIPIYFKGHNSFFFYALSFIRKHLGIKVNIELLFLVDEMYKNQGSTFKAYFGEPIPWQTFVGKNAKKEASRIKEFIYEKKDKLAE